MPESSLGNLRYRVALTLPASAIVPLALLRTSISRWMTAGKTQPGREPGMRGRKPIVRLVS